MRKTKFGIIGCGMIAKWHADSFEAIENAELIGVYDMNYEFAKKFAESRGCRCFETMEELLECDEIDVVSICTPSGLHAEIAVRAANAGKHIIVEKPMAITHKQIDDMTEACEKNGVKVAVISQLRFTESVKKVKKAIDNGELGDIILADVYMKYYRSPEYYASAKWRGTWSLDGGGALMNQGIHGIDVLQYLVGGVKSVIGNCKTLARDIEVEDTANVLVEYKNGALGTIQGTTSVNPGYPRIIEISGTNGTIVLQEDTIIRWDVNGKELDPSEIKTSSYGGSKNPGDISNEYHILQIRDLIDAIENDRRPMCDIYEGRKPVDIILAAYESSRTGKKVFVG